MNMELLGTQIALGLVSGVLLVLLALGLNLILGQLEFINFSHGALYMLGAYVTAYLVGAFHSYWWALLLVPVIMGLVGLALERTLIRPMYGRNQIDALLLTFGLTYVIVESVRAIAGSGGRSIPAPSQLAFQVSVGLGRPFPAYLVFVVVLVTLVVVGLWLFLNHTNVGLIVRAGIGDSDMIRALGINFARYRTMVFVIGVAMAGLAGVLTGPITGVHPEMGADILVMAFVVVVVGGMGSFWGSVVSGLLIGLLVSLTTLYASTYASIAPFVLMILVMTFRPRGLLGTT
jgi:branched-chain amino acid transport system permease protein